MGVNDRKLDHMTLALMFSPLHDERWV